ncbi:hypothetical protein CRM22_002156 [Opisthorchis felineus]|uniref:Uncharacterized protein n=1 Tax=Opisthorchis felineus TaxID=147828 RepID=A0A4S2MBS5_OPIFE|nr:hypothetical protein CRM22_002156 [Opisthorchis felineus]
MEIASSISFVGLSYRWLHRRLLLSYRIMQAILFEGHPAAKFVLPHKDLPLREEDLGRSALTVVRCITDVPCLIRWMQSLSLQTELYYLLSVLSFFCLSPTNVLPANGNFFYIYRVVIWAMFMLPGMFLTDVPSFLLLCEY